MPMRMSLVASSALVALSATFFWPTPREAQAQTIETYSVYCADDRIEISFWDLAQMIVRRGNPVCLFASYTSRSSAMTFAEKNFGGEGRPCWCR
jgi:hypothetical protein